MNLIKLFFIKRTINKIKSYQIKMINKLVKNFSNDENFKNIIFNRKIYLDTRYDLLISIINGIVVNNRDDFNKRVKLYFNNEDKILENNKKIIDFLAK
ncbi:MAG: hypothetical protein J6J27_02175 [Alphaproteobacteria bacterium]|nr:hypothetical protein [Alphaproteobacteria bacterium]